MKTSASSTSGFENLGPPTTFSSLQQAPTLIHIPYRIYPETTAGMWENHLHDSILQQKRSPVGFSPFEASSVWLRARFSEVISTTGAECSEVLELQSAPQKKQAGFQSNAGLPTRKSQSPGSSWLLSTPQNQSTHQNSTFSASLPNNAAHTTCCPQIKLPRFIAGQNRLFFITAKSRKGNVIFSNISEYTLQKICKHLQHLSKKKKVLVQCCMWKQLTGKDENLLPILKKEIFGYQWITNLS